RDARVHGVEVRPVDVNSSRWDCTLESGEARGARREKKREGGNGKAEATTAPRSSLLVPRSFLRLGLRMLNGIGEAVGRTIEQARTAGPFLSIDDFARRTRLGRPIVQRLAEADAFGSLGKNRRQALWQALGQEKKQRAMPLFETLPLPLGEGRGEGACASHQQYDPGQDGSAILPVTLPTMQPFEEVVADYRTAGLSLRAHPISFYREQLERLGITPARQLVELKNDAPVIVAGLVLLRQRPGTAKGITFVTLEDETGTVNLVVHQHTWDRYYRIARRAPAWIAHGCVQTAPGNYSAVIHVVVSRLEALADKLRQLDVKARDFR
ncbi:MAG TPA: hypothetical protein VHE81_13150, partial [Lacipirellulaceae bacterium]|nr:hypothetical protein [Lacipirellulaceae bacterium]